MLRLRVVVLFALLGVLLVVPAARAEGWSWSSLNPFAAEEKPARKQSGLPFSPSRSQKSEPSTLSKMTTGTKRMFKKTTGALTPGKPSRKKSNK